MGTAEGWRTRKYHGFFLGIPGRSECSYLADIGIEVGGRQLWPHLYSGPQGPVTYPDAPASTYRAHPWPQWTWKVAGGSFTFRVDAGTGGGIRLAWDWRPRGRSAAPPTQLRIRLFWAMRDLHGLGGREWSWAPLHGDRAKVTGPEGREVTCRLDGGLRWEDAPNWYYRFHYPEESARGYEAEEDLYSAGQLVGELPKGAPASFALVLAEDPRDLDVYSEIPEDSRAPILDFSLSRPAGVTAGFPWFGEWGRDTFISLPGMVAARVAAGEKPEAVWKWACEVLLRWGEWIPRSGMLPNLIERGGTHQWESADATLWWCHSLAAIWQMSLAPEPALAEVENDFRTLLGEAIAGIALGRHRFLRLEEEGLLVVTEPHVTWMDARVDGVPVTPRTGRLPEINALWFQARALHAIWTGTDEPALGDLGRTILALTDEMDRPNRIFLHSIPLAPSFVLREPEILKRDLAWIAENFWTPVGLRTLAPHSPEFRARCVGSACERDGVYHQGPAWGWLGGHFEMAMNRIPHHPEEPYLPRAPHARTLSPEVLDEMPITGHVAELFDGEPPFTARGAPAQAWSLACHEEAQARRRRRLDARLSRVLARRWLGRDERKRLAGAG